MTPSHRIAVLLAGAALLCAGAAQAQGLAGIPPGPASIPMFRERITTEGERNRVLNEMEIGARSMWSGDTETAKVSFDQAILRIQSVFADSPTAANARKLWYDEGSKLFKGEPYERAMAFLYRGMLYLREADYENARAAFRQGLMQDAFAEESQNRADFAALLFLDAWASHLNGDRDMSEETQKQLKLLRPNFPGIAPDADTLVYVETGLAPRKLGDGANHSYFVFKRGKNITERRAELVQGEVVTPIVPVEDVFYQAATRGGREVDQILQGKATFKNTTGAIGSVFSDTVLAINDNAALQGSSLGDAAGVLAGISVVSLIISSNTKPAADTRTWSSLPDTIHVLTLSTKGQPAPASVRFLDKDGAPVAGFDKDVQFQTDPRGAVLALVRSR
jgi:hypothetical protein